ncbi:hypothetical protein ACFOUP_08840 [Belliella kenyensis]|uniref:Uncharacterized protein n=1 Tax=Belliella kenyensis TaxID=1472724 RepID=A0ABV8EMN9_9BACT|nr:hypothetical protein [Belliella kenyensis]MCH7403866.1 hypothetical protein [Belliella kenyensis]MDN3604873.1 hypothetical protein [Belliella kenyensis]
MNFINVIYLGWYHILDKTVYLYGRENDGFGLKEHAFCIAFLLHGINIWSLTRFILIKCFNMTSNLYLSLFILVSILLLGYFSFLKNKADNIIISEVSLFKGIVMIAITLVYSFITVYLMFEVGNQIRDMRFEIT